MWSHGYHNLFTRQTWLDFGSRKFIHNSFTDLTFSDKCALAKYLFLYLEFPNEFATTLNQLCYSKYVGEFLMTIVVTIEYAMLLCSEYFWIFWFSFAGSPNLIVYFKFMNGFVVVVNSSQNVKSVDELWMDLRDPKSNQVCRVIVSIV